MHFRGKFASVEAMLAAVHEIASDKRTAFQARLKNLLRVGLLDDVKAGRGKAATFEAHHILLLALGMEFAQMDVAPEHAARIIQANRSSIAAAVLATIQTRAGEFSENWSPTVLYFDPRGLQQLSVEPDLPYSVGFSRIDDFPPIFREEVSTRRRLGVISISAVIVKISEQISSPVSASFRDFAERAFATALHDWARTESRADGDDPQA